MDHQKAARDIQRTLAHHHEGVLYADGVISHIPFLLDGASGRLAFPCDHHAADAEELVLHVPEDSLDPSHLRLLLEIVGEPSEALRDRHFAYHGRLGEPRWILAQVDAFRGFGEVFDGVEIDLTNPLRKDEPALLRALNADHARLRRACERATSTDWREPVCVGVDPFGLSLRAGARVRRVPLDLATDPARTLESFLAGGDA